jgi:hypothetical protein
MVDQDAPDPEWGRLLRREALRRAAEELNTTSEPGLEEVLARISAEVTAEAAYRKRAIAVRETDHDATHVAPIQKLPG